MFIHLIQYSLLVIFGAMMILGWSTSRVYAQEAIQYPIVFDYGEKKKLNQLGLSFGMDLRNKCYYYGDGGYSISVSDEFLKRYQKRGFSLNSLCLGLVSGIRFDPETGARLPTYIVADLKEVKKQVRKYGEKKSKEHLRIGVVNDELPLELPRCFSRGVPYSDCEMRFDPLTGKKLSTARRQRWQSMGAMAERLITEKMKEGWWARECTREENKQGHWSNVPPCRAEKVSQDDDLYYNFSGVLIPELRDLTEVYYMSKMDAPPEVYDWEKYEDYHISFIDVSPAFPNGFGYALYADGGAGPSTDPGAVKAALDGKKRATEAWIHEIKVRHKGKKK